MLRDNKCQCQIHTRQRKRDTGHVKRYLCDHNDSQHISFVKGQVVFWCAFEVVPGHTLCALRPWSLCGDVGRSLISKQITFLFLYLCSDTQPCLSFSGLSYLDLCHGEAVQSSHRSGFLASTIRAGKHIHVQYLWRKTEEYDEAAPQTYAQDGRRWILLCSGTS